MLNLSLDTLRPNRFEQMTRRRGHERVLETLDLALSLGFDPVKVGLPCQFNPSCLREVGAKSCSIETAHRMKAQSKRHNPSLGCCSREQ